MKEAKYKDIRDSLKTFDLVLFSGKGFLSNTIKFFSMSKYSHIGMVIRRDDLTLTIDGYREGSVLLFESTTLGNSKDIFSELPSKGVQLVYLSEKQATYKGDVYFRRLEFNRTEENIKLLNKFFLATHNRPYERNKKELFFSCIPFINLTESLNSIFCSELIAELFKRICLIARNKPSNSFTPKTLDGFNFIGAKKFPLIKCT